jgi:prepilin-type N-terminal cleavage/methylation domain-containing protein
MTHPGRCRSACAGFTLVELLIIMAVIAVLSAVAVAGYRHARVSAGETVAVAGLTTINQAQFSFSQACGDQHFSPTLAGLATPAPATGQGFISPDLAADPVLKSNGLTPVTTYQVSADPVAGGVTGAMFYGTNTDRVIFGDTSTFAGNMPETGAPGHGSEVK